VTYTNTAIWIPTDADPGMTLKEVAARLRVHPETVRRLVRKGDLRAGRIGNGYRVLERDLREYLESLWVDQAPTDESASKT
jgi:excisionase family DNA binding protein